MDAARANQVIEQAQASAVHGPWSDHISKILTREERQSVVAVWDTMPGYTCFVDALYRIARGEA